MLLIFQWRNMMWWITRCQCSVGRSHARFIYSKFIRAQFCLLYIIIIIVVTNNAIIILHVLFAWQLQPHIFSYMGIIFSLSPSFFSHTLPPTLFFWLWGAKSSELLFSFELSLVWNIFKFVINVYLIKIVYILNSINH